MRFFYALSDLECAKICAVLLRGLLCLILFAVWAVFIFCLYEEQKCVISLFLPFMTQIPTNVLAACLVPLDKQL